MSFSDSSPSKSSPLELLSDHLAKCKLEFEESSYASSQKINQLTTELDQYKRRCAELTAHNARLTSELEQKRKENATKWRVQEREDWKSLVERLRIDKRALQDKLDKRGASLGTNEKSDARAQELEKQLEIERQMHAEAVDALRRKLDRELQLKFQSTRRGGSERRNAVPEDDVVEKETVSASSTPRRGVFSFLSDFLFEDEYEDVYDEDEE